MFVFTLFCDIHDIHWMGSFVEEFEITFLYQFVLAMSDFRGLWSVALKNGRQSRKT